MGHRGGRSACSDGRHHRIAIRTTGGTAYRDGQAEGGRSLVWTELLAFASSGMGAGGPGALHEHGAVGHGRAAARGRSRAVLAGANVQALKHSSVRAFFPSCVAGSGVCERGGVLRGDAAVAGTGRVFALCLRGVLYRHGLDDGEVQRFAADDAEQGDVALLRAIEFFHGGAQVHEPVPGYSAPGGRVDASAYAMQEVRQPPTYYWLAAATMKAASVVGLDATHTRTRPGRFG